MHKDQQNNNHIGVLLVYLVGRVSGVPKRTLEDVSENHSRCVGAVVAGADVGACDDVVVHAATQLWVGVVSVVQ
jgi:hypothetical protein